MIKYTLIILLTINIAYADCDFSTDITKVDGGYLYTTECHLEVGKNQKRLTLLESENLELRKSIELKDLALVRQQERVQLWMDTTYKLEDRINTIDRIQSTNKLLYILMGVGLTTIAVYGAGQLR